MGQNFQAYMEQIRQKGAGNAQKKQAILEEMGFFEKEYTNEDHASPEYPYAEWDVYTQKNIYFKKVFPEMTDEEYTELLQYREAHHTVSRNSAVFLFRLLAVTLAVITLGLGVLFGLPDEINTTEFIFETALPYWITGFIGGMILLGFAEVIRLLNDLKNK